MHAYGAEVYFFPDLKYGVVTLANTAFSSNAIGDILAWHLVGEKLGLPQDERHDWGGEYAEPPFLSFFLSSPHPARDANGRRSSSWAKTFTGLRARMATALDDAYPDRPQPPLPPALPLEKYAGAYYHAGYQDLVLDLAGSARGAKTPSLVAERPNMTWPMRWEFQHVSGEHWIGYIEMLHERSGLFNDYSRASFDIGPAGDVAALVVEFRDAAGKATETSIRFDRLL